MNKIYTVFFTQNGVNMKETIGATSEKKAIEKVKAKFAGTVIINGIGQLV